MSMLGELPERLSPIRRLALATGMTEGQAYTLVIGLALGLTTAAIGIPPTLRDRVAPFAGAARPAATAAPAPAAPATTDPATPALAGPAFVPSTADRPAGASSFAVEPAAAPAATASDPAPAPADPGRLGEVELLATAPGGPHGIAVDDGSGDFYVATRSAGIARFDRDGRLERTYDLAGEHTGLLLDGDRLVVLGGPAGTVVELDVRTGATRTIATIEEALPGASPMLHDVVAAPDGGLLVSDAGQGAIWHVADGGEVTEWYRGPELLSADGGGPAGLAVEGDGAVLVAVGRSAVALTGAVYRIPAGGGAATQVYRSRPNTTLAGLAVGVSGRIYVAAAGAPGVVVLEQDGTEVTTIAGDPLDGPTGLAFRDRSLLVTNPSGKIVRAPVEDRG